MTVKAICWRKPDLGDTSKVGGLGYCLCEGSYSADTPWGTISTQNVCFDLMSSAATENSIYFRVKRFLVLLGQKGCQRGFLSSRQPLEFPGRMSSFSMRSILPWLAERVKIKCGNAIFSRSAAASAKATCPQSVTWECWKCRRNGILFQHHKSSRIFCHPQIAPECVWSISETWASQLFFCPGFQSKLLLKPFFLFPYCYWWYFKGSINNIFINIFLLI